MFPFRFVEIGQFLAIGMYQGDFIRLKTTYPKFHLNIPGANELTGSNVPHTTYSSVRA